MNDTRLVDVKATILRGIETPVPVAERREAQRVGNAHLAQTALPGSSLISMSWETLNGC
jgi:hypothetical protein